MSDDKTKRDGQDRKRINLGEDYEVRYWAGEFGVSKRQLEDAVYAVGDQADKVREYLKTHLIHD